MSHAIRTAAILISIGLLTAACSGSSKKGGRTPLESLPKPVPDAAAAVTATGATAGAADEPGAAAGVKDTGRKQLERGKDIVERLTELDMTRWRVVARGAGAGRSWIAPTCADGACTFTARRVGDITFISPVDKTSFDPEQGRVVLNKHGITLTQYADAELASYGAWLQDSGFAVERARFRAPGGTTADLTYGIAAGERTGGRPSGGNATYNGLMVGMVVTSGDQEGHTIQGDARIEWVQSDNQIDAYFTNLQDLTDTTKPDLANFDFEDVDVSQADGTFTQGSPGERIDGAFYGLAATGRAHGEVAGTLEHTDSTTSKLLVGAFGAKK